MLTVSATTLSEAVQKLVVPLAQSYKQKIDESEARYEVVIKLYSLHLDVAFSETILSGSRVCPMAHA